MEIRVWEDFRQTKQNKLQFSNNNSKAYLN